MTTQEDQSRTVCTQTQEEAANATQKGPSPSGFTLSHRTNTKTRCKPLSRPKCKFLFQHQPVHELDARFKVSIIHTALKNLYSLLKLDTELRGAPRNGDTISQRYSSEGGGFACAKCLILNIQMWSISYHGDLTQYHLHNSKARGSPEVIFPTP